MSSIINSVSFSALKWAMIEKPLDDIERKRNKILCDLGENLTTNNIFLKTNLITIGDYYYLIIRDKLIKYVKLPQISNNKEINKEKNKKKINNKTKIILDNNNKIVNNNMDLIINIFNDNIQDKNYSQLIYSNNYIEFRIIILLKLIQYYIDNFNKNEIEELIIACNKINNIIISSSNLFDKICNIENFDISLSAILMNDFKFKLDELKMKCDIKLYDIAIARPKLIFETKYDSTISLMNDKPYKPQIDLIDAVKNNLENGFLIYLKTLTGLGKTTSILSISKYISLLDKPYKVIFCCSNLLDSVRIQVAKLMFNFGLKFGIGNAIGDDKYQIKISWNYAQDKRKAEKIKELPNINKIIDYHKIHLCDTLICDYVTTYLILKNNVEFNFILFFDEPTLMTDNIENTKILEYLNKILYYAPKNTILSSATLPERESIINFENHFKNKYNDAFITSILSNKTLVGCIIKDFNNNIITPHINCNNCYELKLFLSKFKNNPLMGKFYTLPYLMNLNKFLKDYNKSIDLDEITQFEQENILENILLLLNKIDESIDYIKFKNITCSLNDDCSLNNKLLENDYESIVHNKLLTSHSFKYIGICLIADINPMKYVKTYFYPIVNNIKIQLKIKNIGDEYDKYKSNIKKVEDEILSIINSMKEDDTGIKQCAIENAKKKIKKLNFRSIFQVNTEDHLKMFSKYVIDYDKSMLCNKINYENIDINSFAIDDDLKFLLYMGIGVYSLQLDEVYTNTVIELLNEKKLAFLVAGEEFSYGSNYPISKIIINDSFGEKHSINTILQLIGRTGRVGKSYFGSVYIETNTINKLIEFFKMNEYSSNEGINISNSFDKTINDIFLLNKKIEDDNENIRLQLIKINEETTKKLLKKQSEELKKKELETVIKYEEDNWRSSFKSNAFKEEIKEPIVKVEYTKLFSKPIEQTKINLRLSKEDELFNKLYKKK